ncbi:MAG: protein kinase domain-containing protein [Planctomycetota bacterium]
MHLAELTTCVLERRGYDITCTHNPGTILQRVQKERPHLVILDQAQMGGRRGVEICRKLREVFTRQEIPILLLTHAGEEGPILEGVAAGANECLTVPYRAHELVAQTAILIRRRKREESRRLARRVLHRVISGEEVDLAGGLPFGNYVLQKVLGRGCMGAVFLAKDPESGEDLALKVLDPDLHTDGRAMKRLQREGKLLMGIRHDNIVTVHKVTSCDGFSYLAMEYVEGQSLMRRLEAMELAEDYEPFDAVAAFDIFLQVASALGAMWASNLIHRDVKPENILLTPSGSVKLVDFGLARSDEDEPLTRSGIIYGTPNYMSPEQIQGLELDFRTDVYSLGATLYHVLTGRAPFESPSTRGILYRHVFEDLRFPRRMRPDLPPIATEVVCRMMAKDPEARYANFLSLRKALEEARDTVLETRRGEAAVIADERPPAWPDAERSE